MITAILACGTIGAGSFATIQASRWEVGSPGHPRNPRRKIWLKTYQIGKHEVTNAEFARFVEATGYVTDAERNRNALVFVPPMKEFRWKEDRTAYWRFPIGQSRGGIAEKMDHPVTCISWRDAMAYCKWAGGRLPTLDEWEVACRAGTKGDHFFGEDMAALMEYANVWHGNNHQTADQTDGFVTTSPVGRFKPNPWGLYDVYGNVFEFCADAPKGDPRPQIAHSRGGSWWCSAHTCRFFNSVDIGDVAKVASFSNLGFRMVRNVLPPLL